MKITCVEAARRALLRDIDEGNRREPRHHRLRTQPGWANPGWGSSTGMT
jgi:hypothetical protein